MFIIYYLQCSAMMMEGGYLLATMSTGGEYILYKQ